MKKVLLVIAALAICFCSGIPWVFGQESEGKKILPEEIIDNKVPTHLPIKVEILYGKKRHTLENVEIKITNTGKRPIYYLDFLLSTSGFPMEYNVAWLTFGRHEMRTLQERATADDPFLGPDDTYVFQLDNKRVENFRKSRAAQGLYPTNYGLVVQVLGFGDGTGYMGPEGSEFPSRKGVPPMDAREKRPAFF